MIRRTLLAGIALGVQPGGGGVGLGCGQAQGLLDLCRSDRGWQAGPSSTSSGRQAVAKEFGDKVDGLSGERSRRRGCQSGC